MLPTDQGITAPGGAGGREAFSQPGRRERYQLPPFPPNPSPGQTFLYGKKVYAYIPNKAGRFQWQVIEERDMPTIGQHVFVSPNRESGLTLDQAREKRDGPEQQQIRNRAEQIGREEGYPPLRLWDAIGNWTTGSENSLLIEFRQVPVMALERVAARLGQEFDQEAVAIFRSRRQGSYLRWTAGFRLPVEAVIPAFKKQGIKHRTIVERPGGCVVVVCGELEKLRPRVDQVTKALQHVKEVGKVVRGDFRLIWRSQYVAILGEGHGRREQMAKVELHWFMNEEIVSQLSDKNRILAQIMRDGYLASKTRTPEEEERLWEQAKQECLARGDEWEEPEDDEKEDVVM